MKALSTREDWEGRASRTEMRVTPWIEGAYRASARADRSDFVSPATGAILYEFPGGSAEDVDAAVASARASFDDQRWRGLAIGERRRVLLAFAELIDVHRDELALIEALEVGKVVTKARADIGLAVAFFRFYAEAIDKLYGEIAPSDGSLMALSLYEPRGVVGAVIPWNFPVLNVAYKAAPALAAGNSVVLKPSEIASFAALRLAELACEAGLPAGVLNVVPGFGQSVGEALARHGDVDLLTFTGSTATGRMLMRFSGESNGKPLMLECGGKSPQLICADMADEVEPLAQRIVDDMFWNQGQWCAARSRLIIEGDLYEPLLEAVAAAAAKLTPGHPLDPDAMFGTISSQRQFERIQSLVAAGERDGARKVLAGDTGSPCAWSMAPTIFGDVSRDMTIAREEIFGPVLCAFRARGFEEGIGLANDTDYGLGATIWTHDARQALAAARQLRAGRVAVRTATSATGSAGLSLAAEPVGASGFGVEKGMAGLKSYCRVRSVEFY